MSSIICCINQLFSKDSVKTQSLTDRAGYVTEPVLTRGPVILRMWYSSSLWVRGTLWRTHLQQKSLSLDPSMSAAQDTSTGPYTEVSVFSLMNLMQFLSRMLERMEILLGSQLPWNQAKAS